jgi:hypothetical protein
VQGNKIINVANANIRMSPQNGFLLEINERNNGALKSMYRSMIPFMSVYLSMDIDVVQSLLSSMYKIDFQ